jgi:hypothetical protein
MAVRLMNGRVAVLNGGDGGTIEMSIRYLSAVRHAGLTTALKANEALELPRGRRHEVSILIAIGGPVG